MLLFEWVEQLEAHPPADPAKRVVRYEVVNGDGTTHSFRWLNGVPLNDTHFDLEVNFLDYRERRRNGKEKRFSWVTDLRIDPSNAMKLMRAGRARWRIENETFNTLKNQGYEFEHNFGHGEKNLATVFATLMMLAFAIDQVQKMCCASAVPVNAADRYVWRAGPVAAGGQATGRQAPSLRRRTMSFDGYLSPEAPPRCTPGPRREPLRRVIDHQFTPIAERYRLVQRLPIRQGEVQE